MRAFTAYVFTMQPSPYMKANVVLLYNVQESFNKIKSICHLRTSSPLS